MKILSEVKMKRLKAMGYLVANASGNNLVDRDKTQAAVSL